MKGAFRCPPAQRSAPLARFTINSVFHASARARGKSESYQASEGDNIGGAHNDRTPGASSGHPRASARGVCALYRGRERGIGDPGVGWRWGIIARLRSLREEDSVGRLHDSR